MATTQQNKVYRVLAFCLALGAGGLAAWYHLVQVPLVAQVQEASAALKALEARPAEPAAEVPVVPAPTPTPAAAQTDPAEIQAACAALRAQLSELPTSVDANATRFAVEEIVRNARLRNASVDADTVTTEGVLTSHQLQIAVEGETRYIQQIVDLVLEYKEAGVPAAMRLSAPPIPEDESSSQRRRRVARGPLLQGTIDIEALYVDDANALLASHCAAN